MFLLFSGHYFFPPNGNEQMKMELKQSQLKTLLTHHLSNPLAFTHSLRVKYISPPRCFSWPHTSWLSFLRSSIFISHPVFISSTALTILDSPRNKIFVEIPHSDIQLTMTWVVGQYSIILAWSSPWIPVRMGMT